MTGTDNDRVVGWTSNSQPLIFQLTSNKVQRKKRISSDLLWHINMLKVDKMFHFWTNCWAHAIKIYFKVFGRGVSGFENGLFVYVMISTVYIQTYAIAPIYSMILISYWPLVFWWFSVLTSLPYQMCVIPISVMMQSILKYHIVVLS